MEPLLTGEQVRKQLPPGKILGAHMERDDYYYGEWVEDETEETEEEE